MHVLDVFSGIGGFSLGLERAGLRTVAFCECDRYATQVLRSHWPGIPCYPDIRRLSADRLARDGVPPPQLICAGFPCQDISPAGRGAGITGARSGLWRELVRLVAECRPRWLVAENVPALRSRGADQVFAAVEALGYASWPLVVGADHAGAAHRRRRLWIVAHAGGARLEDRIGGATRQASCLPVERRGGWSAEPGVGRMADGLPSRVDRLRCLGNAIVPDIATFIGRAIWHVEARLGADSR